MSNCDDPDLWSKRKAAQDPFLINQSFRQRFSPPSSPTSPSLPLSSPHQNANQTPLNPINKSSRSLGASTSPKTKATQKVSPRAERPEGKLVSAGSKSTKAGSSPASNKNNLPATPEPKARSVPDGFGQKTGTSISRGENLLPIEATNTTSTLPLPPAQKPSRPRPCVPLTREEAIIKARGRIPTKKSLTQQNHQRPILAHAPHVPSPLANEVPATSPVKNTLKMSESSDEIVLSRAKRRDTSCNPRPVGTFRKPTGVGLLSDDDLSSEGEAANNQKENYRETVMDNVKEELERLRKPIVVNAHRRVSDWPTASPELLKRYRTGPGTDQCSKEYLEIAQIRAVLQAEIPDLSYLPGSSQVFEETSHDADPDALKRQLQSHLKVRQEVYKKTETAFPTLIDGTITLSPTPTKKHRKALAQSRYPKAPEGTLNPKSLLAGKDEVLILHSSWDDPVILDWAYCPRCITDEKAYHVDFQRWLDVTISHECTVDIYHQTFFDGTSHADGESSMFMLDMCSFETQLDPRDEASRLHAHETAAGYILNLLMQTQEAEVAEEHRRLMSRKANLEYQQKRALNMRTPASPVANIYLRPVDDRDASELKDILDEFAHDSFETPDTMSINRSEVRGRIESSRTARLPFIVAVDRRTASTTPEKILGYALAKDFESPHRGSQYTAELEVYVRKEHTNLGIGRCLLDKLLEVCDPSYISKSGYQFEASYGERSAYYPGGSRKLARLLFKLGYVDQEISKHNRVKRWLKDHAGFEEQGVLRGVRLKKKFLVNVTYLVRNVGHSKSNKWEP